MPPAVIDEKYLVFLREFSKVALRKNNSQACRENPQSQGNLEQFATVLLTQENKQIESLAADNAESLSAQLDASIEQLERHYFDREPGEAPDLRAVAEEWVRRAA